MASMIVPLEGFQTIQDQSEMEYWQNQMKDDDQFIQFMTEIFKKKQLELQREQKNNKMNHLSHSSSVSLPPPAHESMRHLPRLMDQPVMLSDSQQLYNRCRTHQTETASDNNNLLHQNQSISTPRRSLDEGSPEYQIQQRSKKSRPHEPSPQTGPPNKVPFSSSTTTTGNHHHQVLPSHVKRAVTNNLPCFYVKFRCEDEADQGQSISAMKVAEWIRQTSYQQFGQAISDLSLLIPVGKDRFKIGVASKKSFLQLWNCKWPDHMDKFEVEVERPRALPDCCALVVRHVPADLPGEFVFKEILKSIKSAMSFTKMNYHRPRPTNDFRFCVLSENEYNEMVNIGRLAIGHVLVPVTSFLPSLKMTYCTNCLELGHVRQECKVGPRCRLCLDAWDRNHKCITPTLCAQCRGPHLSLSMECQVVKSYRRALKDEVNKAVEEGRANQFNINKSVGRLGEQDADFPPLKKSNGTKTIWGAVQRTTNECNDPSYQGQLSDIVIQIKNVLDVSQRMEAKLDNQMNRIDTLDKMSAINKQGIIVLSNIIQQTINRMLEKKNKSQLQNLSHQIELFKEDFVEKSLSA